MPDCQITCIIKPHSQSPHEHITHAGNPAGGWVWTREQIIASIDARTNTFFVTDPQSGKRANVHVRREVGKLPYLQTQADGYWGNNLLSLIQCPLR